MAISCTYKGKTYNNEADLKNAAMEQVSGELRAEKAISQILPHIPNARIIARTGLGDERGAFAAVLGKSDPIREELGLNPDVLAIVVDPELFTSEHIYHEMGHILLEALGEDDISVKAAINELRGKELWNEVAAAYPELSGKRLAFEVLSTAIGREGQRQEQQSKIATLIEYIKTKIAKLLGIQPDAVTELTRQMIAGKIREMTLSELLADFSPPDTTEYAKLGPDINDVTDDVSSMSAQEYAKWLADTQKTVQLVDGYNHQGNTYDHVYVTDVNGNLIPLAGSMTGLKESFDAQAHHVATTLRNMTPEERQNAPQGSVAFQKKLAETEARNEKLWAAKSHIGSIIHGFAEEVLLGNMKPNDFDLTFIVDEDSRENALNFLKEMEAMREAVKKKGGIIFPEFRIVYDDYEVDPNNGKFAVPGYVHGLGGSIDVLIVYPNTKTAEILDFKTSGHYAWSIVPGKMPKLSGFYENFQAEGHATQLLGYKHVLEAKYGLKVKSTSIIPIYVNVDQDAVADPSFSPNDDNKPAPVTKFQRDPDIRDIDMPNSAIASALVTIEQYLANGMRHTYNQAANFATMVENFLQKTINSLKEAIRIARQFEGRTAAKIAPLENVLQIYQNEEAIVKAAQHALNRIKALEDQLLTNSGSRAELIYSAIRELEAYEFLEAISMSSHGNDDEFATILSELSDEDADAVKAVASNANGHRTRVLQMAHNAAKSMLADEFIKNSSFADVYAFNKFGAQFDSMHPGRTRNDLYKAERRKFVNDQIKAHRAKGPEYDEKLRTAARYYIDSYPESSWLSMDNMLGLPDQIAKYSLHMQLAMNLLEPGLKEADSNAWNKGLAIEALLNDIKAGRVESKYNPNGLTSYDRFKAFVHKNGTNLISEAAEEVAEAYELLHEQIGLINSLSGTHVSITDSNGKEISGKKDDLIAKLRKDFRNQYYERVNAGEVNAQGKPIKSWKLKKKYIDPRYNEIKDDPVYMMLIAMQEEADMYLKRANVYGSSRLRIDISGMPGSSPIVIQLPTSIASPGDLKKRQALNMSLRDATVWERIRIAFFPRISYALSRYWEFVSTKSGASTWIVRDYEDVMSRGIPRDSNNRYVYANFVKMRGKLSSSKALNRSLQNYDLLQIFTDNLRHSGRFMVQNEVAPQLELLRMSSEKSARSVSVTRGASIRKDNEGNADVFWNEDFIKDVEEKVNAFNRFMSAVKVVAKIAETGIDAAKSRGKVAMEKKGKDKSKTYDALTTYIENRVYSMEKSAETTEKTKKRIWRTLYGGGQALKNWMSLTSIPYNMMAQAANFGNPYLQQKFTNIAGVLANATEYNWKFTLSNFAKEMGYREADVIAQGAYNKIRGLYNRMLSTPSENAAELLLSDISGRRPFTKEAMLLHQFYYKATSHNTSSESGLRRVISASVTENWSRLGYFMQSYGERMAFTFHAISELDKMYVTDANGNLLTADGKLAKGVEDAQSVWNAMERVVMTNLGEMPLTEYMKRADPNLQLIGAPYLKIPPYTSQGSFDEERLSRKLINSYEHFTGGYNDRFKNRLEMTMFGGLLLQFRKWMYNTFLSWWRGFGPASELLVKEVWNVFNDKTPIDPFGYLTEDEIKAIHATAKTQEGQEEVLAIMDTVLSTSTYDLDTHGFDHTGRMVGIARSIAKIPRIASMLMRKDFMHNVRLLITKGESALVDHVYGKGASAISGYGASIGTGMAGIGGLLYGVVWYTWAQAMNVVTEAILSGLEECRGNTDKEECRKRNNTLYMYATYISRLRMELRAGLNLLELWKLTQRPIPAGNAGVDMYKAAEYYYKYKMAQRSGKTPENGWVNPDAFYIRATYPYLAGDPKYLKYLNKSAPRIIPEEFADEVDAYLSQWGEFSDDIKALTIRRKNYLDQYKFTNEGLWGDAREPYKKKKKKAGSSSGFKVGKTGIGNFDIGDYKGG